MQDNKNIKKIVGNVLKELRMSKGLTQEKLSEHLGLQPNTITQIEIGRNFISSELLAKFCEYFKVAPLVFFMSKPEFIYKEHINYSNKISNLLPSFSNEKLHEIYNILLVMQK